MKTFFTIYLIIMLVVTFAVLGRVFRGPGVYDRFSGILIIGTNIIMLLVLFGFIDGRVDMYVDIAVSYAVLGFISSVVVAKFLGSKGE